MLANKESKVTKVRIIFQLLMILEGEMIKRPMRKLNHALECITLESWKIASHTRKTLLLIKHLILI